MSSPPQSELPSFSVIIATRNRPTVLAECLESFTRLDYPPNLWELIVVNDGGEYSFTAIMDELRHALPVRFIDIPHSGPAAARNAGARAATGEYLAMTDDDCTVDPDWLRALAQGFGKGWDALGGCTRNSRPDKRGAEAWHILIDFLQTYFRDYRGNAILLVSCNVAYKASVFQSISGFDEHFPMAAAEDREISYRLLSSGFSQEYWPDAVVWHHQINMTPLKHLTQQFRYGRGSWHFLQTIRGLNKPRNLTHRPGTDTQYIRSLVAYLRRQRVPLVVSTIVIAGQLCHRLGRYYQGLINRIFRRTQK